MPGFWIQTALTCCMNLSDCVVASLGFGFCEMGWWRQARPSLVSPDGIELGNSSEALEMRVWLVVAGVRLPGGAVGAKEKRCLRPTPAPEGNINSL